MMFVILLLSLLGIFSSVLAIPTPTTTSSAVIPSLPYPEVPFIFTGNWGGHDVSLTGTAQEMIAHMQAMHPDFEFTEPPQEAPVSVNPGKVLETAFKSGHLCCTTAPIPGQSFRPAHISKTIDNIDYLQQVPLCWVNGRTCVRIACQWNSGIFLCNDNDYQIHPSCSYLASYAQDLIAFCGAGTIVCGQEFDTDRYNVIVQGSNC